MTSTLITVIVIFAVLLAAVTFTEKLVRHRANEMPGEDDLA